MSRFLIVTIDAKPKSLSYDVELTGEAMSYPDSEIGRIVYVVLIRDGLARAGGPYDQTHCEEAGRPPDQSRGLAITHEAYPGVYIWPRDR